MRNSNTWSLHSKAVYRAEGKRLKFISLDFVKYGLGVHIIEAGSTDLVLLIFLNF